MNVNKCQPDYMDIGCFLLYIPDKVERMEVTEPLDYLGSRKHGKLCFIGFIHGAAGNLTSRI